MRSTYKLFSLTACVALLISISTLTLTGCRDNNIPVSVPSLPSSSSVPSVSSSSSAPASVSSDTTASEVSSSSKPASSSSGSGGKSGSGSGSYAYDGRTYLKAVTDSKKETLKSVKITASGVYLSNKTITGDLIIDKGVADGKVTLENVTVGKTIYVYGGGENSIYLKSVKAAKLISASTVSRPRIVAQYATNIDKTEIRYDTLLEYDGLNYNAKGFNKIETVKTSQFLTVLKLFNIGTTSLVINDDTNLFLKGSSSVSYLTANSPAYIEGAGAIGTLECNSKNITVDYSPGYITSKSGVGYYTPNVINDSGSSSSSGGSTGTLGTPYLNGSITNVYWSQVSGAELGYELRINLKGSTTYTTLYFSPTETRSLDLQNFLTTYGAPAGYYQVRVKVYATASANESAFSNVLTFYFNGSTTSPTISGLTLSGTDRTKYLLSWTSTNASSYNVTITNSSNVVKLNKEITNPATMQTDLRADMGTNFVAGSYTVRVTAKTMFEQSYLSTGFTVTAAAAPSNFVYNETTKMVSWSGSASASYQVTIKGTTSTVSGTQFNLNDTAYPIGATYSLSVKRLGATGNELDSAVATYSVTKQGPAALPAPTGVTLTRGETSKLSLKWNKAADATNYIVTLYKDSVAVPGQSFSLGDVNTYTFSYTAAAGSYTATVRAHAVDHTDSAPASSNILSLTADDLKFDAGLGTSASPYEVRTQAQFNSIATVTGKYFKQTAAITDAITVPISGFIGHYDGGGNTIKITIGQSGFENIGLFKTIPSGSEVQNITVANESTVIGTSNVGMIAGSNAGTIKNCTVTDISCGVTGTSNVGGICGYNTGTVTDCTYSGKLYQSSAPATSVSDPLPVSFGLIIGTNAAAGGDGGITSPDGVAIPDAMAMRLLPWLSVLSVIL